MCVSEVGLIGRRHVDLKFKDMCHTWSLFKVMDGTVNMLEQNVRHFIQLG